MAYDRVASLHAQSKAATYLLYGICVQQGLQATSPSSDPSAEINWGNKGPERRARLA